MNNFEKLLTSLAEIADTKTVGEDFIKAFEACLELFVEMKADNEKERTDLQAFADKALQTLKDNSTSFTSRLAEQLTSRITEKLASITQPLDGAKGDQGEQGPQGESVIGPPGTNGSPDTPEQIVDKLESLEGDNRLDASAIKNLPEVVKHQAQAIGVHGPLWSLPDVDVVGITVGQSIKWDGIRWIPYTPSGASGNTSVYEEAPTDSGDHLSFTLAHTPVAGTFRLYRGGARQQVTADFTRSGATITLLLALQTNEVLLCDYDY